MAGARAVGPALIRPSHLIGIVLASVLVAACGDSSSQSSSGSPSQTPGTSVSRATNLSAEEAIQVATQTAGHLIGDSPVQQSSAQIPSYGPIFWRVKLTGMFYEPSGPPPDAGTAVPLEPECFEIQVDIDDATGEPTTLSLVPSDSCIEE